MNFRTNEKVCFTYDLSGFIGDYVMKKQVRLRTF